MKLRIITIINMRFYENTFTLKAFYDKIEKIFGGII